MAKLRDEQGVCINPWSGTQVGLNNPDAVTGSGTEGQDSGEMDNVPKWVAAAFAIRSGASSPPESWTGS